MTKRMTISVSEDVENVAQALRKNHGTNISALCAGAIIGEHQRLNPARLHDEQDVIQHVQDLRPGDLLKNRHNGEVYLVAHNYGSEVICVLTKHVRQADGHNWRLHHKGAGELPRRKRRR